MLNRIAVAAALAVLAASMAVSGSENPPRARGVAQPDVQERKDVAFRMTGISAGASVNFGQDPDAKASVERILTVTGVLSARQPGTPFFASQAWLTELTDSNGTDLLDGASPQARLPSLPRRELAIQLAQRAVYPQNHPDHVQAQVRGVACVPDRVGSVRGYVDAFAAGKVVRVRIDREKMDEFIEVMPGVRFLLSRFERGKHMTTVGFEVRIQRTNDGVLDPMFAGVGVFDRGGHYVQGIDRVEEVATRDEYICVVNDWQFRNDFMDTVAQFEVVVLGDVGVERFEFGATDVLLGGVE